MKQILFATLCLLAGAAVSQAQTSRRYMVVYQKQINADSLDAQFRANRTPAGERAVTTLNLLKNISAGSGQALESHLVESAASRAGETIRYTKLWIVNAIVAEVPADMVDEINTFAGVAYMEDITDFKAYLMDPVRMVPEEAATRALTGPEPGLLAVGVRTLWNMGYTGKGIKLMSFDTGLWTSHPALGGRFYGDYMPLDLAWKGIFSPVPADKGNSHGTHTVGTMAGLDTLTHDTIGLAYKAYFMGTDPIVPNLPDTIGMQNLMLAYQWVLDPDGNAGTTDDMPAVICNSWGTNGNASFCGSFVSDMLVNIDLTGIANEYSAGNEGPGVSTTGVPALINPGLVNAFAVGAVDGNSPTYPIASFSSRGPTLCTGTGSLKIKPEVVAPGVNVRSCVKTGDYAFYDGTSMAGPHVAGILLLLREAFPTVAGETLKEALYNSAIDLGDPGEDNTYGMGMINAGAAYDWLVNEGYTPVPPASASPELALEKAPAGVGSFSCEAPATHTIYLYNEGSVTINDTVYFKAGFNGAPIAQWAQHIQLAPQQRMQVTHALAYTPQSGSNELWISARQKNTPVEKDLVNNNRTVRFTHYEPETVPYMQNFETTAFSTINWTVLNPDVGRTFELFNTAGLPSGTKSAAMRFFLYTPATAQKDWLISPPVALNDNTFPHMVEFDVAYQTKTQTQTDTLSLLASLDCGVTFSEVIFTGTPAELVTLNAPNPLNFTPNTAAHWKHLGFLLPPEWNGSTVLFAFRSVNGRGANAYMDNFLVYQPGMSSVPEADNLDVSIFPNPFTEQITIQFGAQTQSVRLSLFDLSGRPVDAFSQNATQTFTWTPRESLASGVYILHVDTGSQQMVYKLMKR